MAEWQPIDTAPKDGTPILVYADCSGWEEYGKSRVVAYWTRHCWAAYGPAFGEPLRSKDGMTPQRIADCNPTHWMPLPTPPQGIEAGTGETARLDGEATKARSAQADAPDKPDARDWQNRAERAEAECKELRAKIRAMALTGLARLDGELIEKGESNGQ